MGRNHRPREKYLEQASHARSRGIAWELTFEEWWQVWSESGKWAVRGKKVGKYCMARFGDEGPYAMWNVKIEKSESNAGEKKTSEVARMKKQVTCPKCGTMGQGMIMYRWHFDNCKEMSHAKTS